MTPIHSRMARAALGWGYRDVARISGMSPATIVRYEKGGSLKAETVEKLRALYDEAGVDFLDQTETAGPGVRLRHPVAAAEAGEDESA